MITWAAAGGMALVALGMVLIPGPNMIYLVSRSVSQGSRAGLTSLLGTLVVFLIYMTMANVGLAVVFLVVPWLYVAMKACGAAYLLYLAWKTLRPGGMSLFETRQLPQDSRWRLFRMGLITNLLNPKAAIMYLALIPQFERPSSGSVVLQGFIFGGVQITVSVIVNASIVVAAGSIAAFMTTRPKWIKWQRIITGSLLGLIGVELAIDAPTPA
jgi:threonine/homoserine/homoserine lactone efflux protein